MYVERERQSMLPRNKYLSSPIFVTSQFYSKPKIPGFYHLIFF